LKNKKILIIGANSSLAKQVFKIIDKSKFLVTKIYKRKLNFNKNYKSSKLKKIIKYSKPDIIINFIGKFSLNNKANQNILTSNILPTWEIIKYFQTNRSKKSIKIIILGSSSYKSPRKKYMLYAATKSALNSLCKSAEEYFVDSKVSIKIYNPSTFGGKHLGRFVKKSNININLVAKKVYKYINQTL
tara:strand:+ start:1145 stop:1705 length:561 start_codon:yes stop_codon:yes gene_type:complete